MQNLPQIQRTHDQKTSGFIDLVKDIESKVEGVYFSYHDNQLASQEEIQTVSYNFIANHLCKSKDGENTPILYYLTKIDITEISNGIIDLSAPSLHEVQYSSELAERIFNENQTGLIYLKNPFDRAIKSKDLEHEIKEFLESLKSQTKENRIESITNFLMQRKNLVEEVVLFCEIIGLVCISQSIYIFSHQISVNNNFVRLIELILEVNNPEFLKTSNVHTLAERYYSVFINNLASRVFSKKTLSIVETALTEGA